MCAMLIPYFFCFFPLPVLCCLHLCVLICCEASLVYGLSSCGSNGYVGDSAMTWMSPITGGERFFFRAHGVSHVLNR